MFVEDVVTENFDRFAVKNNKLDSEGFVQLLHSLFDGAIAMDESVQAVKQSLEKLTSTKNAFDTGVRLKKRATLLNGGKLVLDKCSKGKEIISILPSTGLYSIVAAQPLLSIN